MEKYDNLKDYLVALLLETEKDRGETGLYLSELQEFLEIEISEKLGMEDKDLALYTHISEMVKSIISDYEDEVEEIVAELDREATEEYHELMSEWH